MPAPNPLNRPRKGNRLTIEPLRAKLAARIGAEPRRRHHPQGWTNFPAPFPSCRDENRSSGDHLHGSSGPSGRTGAIRAKAVASTIELEKAERVRDAETLAGAASETAEPAALRRFIAVLYEHVPPSDVATRAPADLCGAALALWRFAARREPGHTKVRVYNPDAGRDGWASPHTVREIVNDDMPFLVDSVTAS